MRPKQDLEQWLLAGAAAAAIALASCGSGSVGKASQAAPAEVRLGERLFREPRFAQSFAARVAGRALGDPVPGGDPVVDEVETTGAPIPGPFAGLSISCAACHLSDEVADVPGGGVRAYCDFARRSPLPARGDGRTATVRNTPALRDAALPRDGATFFHYDGEFASVEDLASATLSGRSLGWLPAERADAVAHVARVLREDDGSDANATAHGGGAYASVLSGASGLAPDGALVPVAFRVDVASASADEVVGAASRLIAAYVRSLSLGADGTSARAFRSPYDRFLEKNGLPTRPAGGESSLAYSRRLRAALLGLSHPLDVGPEDGQFRTHDHPFQFGGVERAGLLTFLAEPPPAPGPPGGASAGGVGSCLSCHAPPAFTDFDFHNIGASQAEYDAVHFLGAFSALPVPGLPERNADPDSFLPPSPGHPGALGPFLAAPRHDSPALADLGLWNVFSNPAVPGPQAALRAAVVARLGLPSSTPDEVLLPLTIGWVKTPTLRDLGHSGPYFHGGHVDTLEDAVQHYRAASLSARSGLVRNSAPELSGISLEVNDLVTLSAFLRSLDEDP